MRRILAARAFSLGGGLGYRTQRVLHAQLLCSHHSLCAWACACNALEEMGPAKRSWGPVRVIMESVSVRFVSRVCASALHVIMPAGQCYKYCTPVFVPV